LVGDQKEVRVRVTVVVWVWPPPVAVMVIVSEPVWAFLEVLIARVEEPVPGAAVVCGLKVTVEPEGAPVAVREMVALKPPETAVAMVKVAVEPARMLVEAGVAERVKDGLGGGLVVEDPVRAAMRPALGLPHPVTRSKPGTAE
jgi:hypothetical protein